MKTLETLISGGSHLGSKGINFLFFSRFYSRKDKSICGNEKSGGF